MLIGYMRVSTGEQSLDLQRDALATDSTSNRGHFRGQGQKVWRTASRCARA